MAPPRVRVGSTGNEPERTETVPISRQRGRQKRVVMSFGRRTRTDSPLPDIQPGDRLLVFAELQVTTDAEDPRHPGLIGNAYSYAPRVEAELLLAADASEAEAGPRALALASPWRETLSHRRHHEMVAFGEGRLEIPPAGLPWSGAAHVNLVVGASNPKAERGDLLLIGENEKTPVVVQDKAGIRVVRLRPGSQPQKAPVRDSASLVAGIPVRKRETVVFSHRLERLRKGEQILVKARLTTDAAALGYAARISCRMFLADSERQREPGGAAVARVASWKGHLSKQTGFNCLPEEGPRSTLKFGVLRIMRDVSRPLFVNLVAVSADPFGGAGPSDELRVIRRESYLDVTRWPAEMEG